MITASISLLSIIIEVQAVNILFKYHLQKYKNLTTKNQKTAVHIEKKTNFDLLNQLFKLNYKKWQSSP